MSKGFPLPSGTRHLFSIKSIRSFVFYTVVDSLSNSSDAMEIEISILYFPQVGRLEGTGVPPPIQNVHQFA